MSQTIHRYEIPVDDQWHTLLVGEILHVDCRKLETVEIWTWAMPTRERVLRVYGTGQAIDLGEDQWVSHVGTALSPTGPGPFSQPYGQIVWHLVERQAKDDGGEGLAEWERELMAKQAGQVTP